MTKEIENKSFHQSSVKTRYLKENELRKGLQLLPDVGHQNARLLSLLGTHIPEGNQQEITNNATHMVKLSDLSLHDQLLLPTVYFS